MKKVKVVIVAMLVALLLTVITVPILAQEVNIQDLVELFISDPAAAMDQLLELAKTNPQAVALVLGEVAARSVKLRATNPDLAASLESAIEITCTTLVDTNPAAAALAVVTIKDKAPDVGEAVEKVVVAYGLEESYLAAASPVRP